jgi:hypothetical protein
VERPHRQLRARLADRLRRDDADRLAELDQLAGREVPAIARRGDTRRSLEPSVERTKGVWSMESDQARIILLVASVRTRLSIKSDCSSLRQNGVRRLAVFGSALRDDFGHGSDVDVLIELKRGQTPGLTFCSLSDAERKDTARSSAFG